MGAVWGFKYLQKIFNKTRLVRNPSVYNFHKQKIENEIKILNIIDKLKKVNVIECNYKDLLEQVGLIR